jgi:hypothetical protein
MLPAPSAKQESQRAVFLPFLLNCRLKNRRVANALPEEKVFFVTNPAAGGCCVGLYSTPE